MVLFLVSSCKRLDLVENERIRMNQAEGTRLTTEVKRTDMAANRWILLELLIVVSKEEFYDVTLFRTTGLRFPQTTSSKPAVAMKHQAIFPAEIQR
eukprot:scaffold332459_cov46-Attheya_sp.AAC.1